MSKNKLFVFLDTEHKRKSMGITLAIHIILILLLLIAGLKYMDPPEVKGIAINFGTSDQGMGNVQPLDEIESAPQNNVASESVPTEIEEEIITQDIEEAPVIEEKKPEKETTPVPDRKEEPKKTEPKPDQATSDALSNILNSPRNQGTAQSGEGNDTTPGDKGSPDGDPNSSSYYGSGVGLDGDGNYLLGGRRALNKERYIPDCNEAGTVVVSIEVDRNGTVTRATPGVRGTTNTAPCLMEPARRAALETKFNPDENAPLRQVGRIIYRFSLSE